MPDTILVTGGAGYLGSLLCRRLLEEGHRVRCFDLLLYGDAGVKELIGHDRFELWEADLSDERRVRAALTGADAVAHLAGLTNDASCELEPDYARYVNLELALRLYQMSLQAGVGLFVNASSCAVYAGCSNGPADEEVPPKPLSLYARLQLQREEALDRQRGAALAHLRLATLHGLSPRMRLDLPLNRLLYHAVKRKEMEVWGGENRRPLLHVADAAEAIILVLQADLPKESVVLNLAGDASVTINRLAEAIVRHVPSARVRIRAETDPRSYAVRAERIGRLGFAPRRTLDDSIREMLAWLKSKTDAELQDPRLDNQKTLASRQPKK